MAHSIYSLGRYHVTGDPPDLIYFRNDIGLKVLPGSQYWSWEIILINNSYPTVFTDIRFSSFFSQSMSIFSGDRWLEILWTEVRVRGEECPFLRVARGSFKEVEIKCWCGRVLRLWPIQMTHSWFMKTQMNFPCQPCKHNPAHSMNSYSRFHPQTFIQHDESN